MGIHQLAKLIADAAPAAMKENDIKNYFGRKIAIDASMSLYQFLIAVRTEGAQLMTDSGETTSHLMGMFYRTIRMIENGIKPIYVFDGKPPQLKSVELSKRLERRGDAQKQLEEAEKAGDTEAIDKFSRRTVKVTQQHNDEVKRLLRLMGVPLIECAAMVKYGLAFATATEDMDGLTFGSKILLRHMTYSEAKKMPIKEYYIEKVLTELQLNMDEFIDLCILLGCDYCDTIKGIGPKKGLEYIQKYRNIETVLENLDKSDARDLFKNHEVLDPAGIELKWNEADEEGLVDFLVKEKSFNEERVRNGAKKLLKSRTTSTQGRIDTFFTVSSSSPATKRKVEEKEVANKKKAGKGPAKSSFKGKK